MRGEINCVLFEDFSSAITSVSVASLKCEHEKEEKSRENAIKIEPLESV